MEMISLDYLKRLIGISVRYISTEDLHLPNFLVSRYRIRKALLNSVEVFFLYPITELESVWNLKKHIEHIQKIKNIPVVLVLGHLTYRQKEYLLNERISFIVENKQIYLPFMAIYLQKNSDAENIDKKELLPASQVLLLYFIYHGSGRMIMSNAVAALGLTSTSISRAVRQLEELDLISTEKAGIQKILYSDLSPKELFEKARGNLQNPVKRVVYVPKDQIHENLLISGYSALAEYSMLGEPNVACYASDSVSQWNSVATKRLMDGHSQVEVELWRYDPKKLSTRDMVDPLSIVLALEGDMDERVEGAVAELLNQVWREIDGKRY